MSSIGNVRVGNTIKNSPSPKLHNDTADTVYTSKGDWTVVGLNDTALSEESSFEESKVPPFDIGKSLPDGRPKRQWIALALFILLAGGVVAIVIFFVTSMAMVVGNAPPQDNSSSGQVSPPKLGDLATFAPTVAFSAAPSIATSHPTKSPELPPHLLPTHRPTPQPTKKRTAAPTITPEMQRTKSPTRSPVVSPTQNPLNATTEVPTLQWNATAAPSTSTETYVPGNLTREEVGLLLSEGLRARIIATSGKPVKYSNGTFSTIPYHGSPDFGATFVDTRPFNEGGWVYTSNSEMKEEGQGGVGSLTFNKEGKIIDYRMVLQNTTMNCGGGSTPWYVCRTS